MRLGITNNFRHYGKRYRSGDEEPEVTFKKERPEWFYRLILLAIFTIIIIISIIVYYATQSQIKP